MTRNLQPSRCPTRSALKLHAVLIPDLVAKHPKDTPRNPEPCVLKAGPQ